jgi:hypothetical protein
MLRIAEVRKRMKHTVNVGFTAVVVVEEDLATGSS